MPAVGSIQVCWKSTKYLEIVDQLPTEIEHVSDLLLAGIDRATKTTAQKGRPVTAAKNKSLAFVRDQTHYCMPFSDYLVFFILVLSANMIKSERTNLLALLSIFLKLLQ